MVKKKRVSEKCGSKKQFLKNQNLAIVGVVIVLALAVVIFGDFGTTGNVVSGDDGLVVHVSNYISGTGVDEVGNVLENVGAESIVGKSGDGYFFNRNDYVQIGEDGLESLPMQIGENDFSVSLWVRTTATSTSPTSMFAWSSKSDSVRFNLAERGGYVYLRAYDQSNDILLDGELNAIVGSDGVAKKIKINDGKWHHIVAVKSGTTAWEQSRPYRVYVDKVKVMHIADDPVIKGKENLQVSTNPAYIGMLRKNDADGSLWKTFRGSIDEVKVFNDGIDNAEIAELYSEFAEEDDLELYVTDHLAGIGEDETSNYALDNFNGTWSAEGVDGGTAFKSDHYGNVAYITVGDASANSLSNQIADGDFSVSGWIKTTNTESTIDTMFFGMYDGNKRFGVGTRLGKASLWVTSATDESRISEGHGDINEEYNIDVNDGVWHHIVAVHNAGTGTDDVKFKLYVDGKKVGQNDEQLGTFAVNRAAILGALGPKSPSSNHSVRTFEGTFDEVKVFKKALSKEEINELYSEFDDVIDPDLELYVTNHFEEGAVGVLDETGGYALDNFNGTWSAEGVDGGTAFKSDHYGNVAYITVGDASANSLSNQIADGDFSVSGWIKTTNTESTIDTMFFGMYDGNKRFGVGTRLGKASLWVTSATDESRISEGHGDINEEYNIDVNDGVWHHIVAVHNAGTGTDDVKFKLYVDGKKVGQNDEQLGTFAVNRAAILGALGPKSPSSNHSVRTFEGTFDEVKVFKKALSKEEINELYSEFDDESLMVDYSGFSNFVPTVGYYFPQDGSRVNLFGNEGGVKKMYTYNFNQKKWFDTTYEFATGGSFSADFAPAVGYYFPEDGARINLFGSSPSDERMYTYNFPNKVWRDTTNEFEAGGSFPSGFSPTVGYYFPENGGRINLFGMLDRDSENIQLYIYNFNQEAWYDRTSEFIGDGKVFSSEFFPIRGFYSYQADAVYLFGTESGVGKVLFANSSNLLTNTYEDITDKLSEMGLPNAIPDLAYSDQIVGGQSVLWYGESVYVSEDGEAFSLVGEDLCGNTVCDIGESCSTCLQDCWRFCSGEVGCSHGNYPRGLPFGARVKINGQKSYCDYQTGTLLDMIGKDATCDNDFECLSNACLEGVCVNYLTEFRGQTSILDKIFCWIKHPITPNTRNACEVAAGVN